MMRGTRVENPFGDMCSCNWTALLTKVRWAYPIGRLVEGQWPCHLGGACSIGCEHAVML